MVRGRRRLRGAGDGPGERPGGDDDLCQPRTAEQERERARDLCLRRLAVRPRTRAELAATLSDYGIDSVAAREVLDRYDEVGLIDDRAFARAWVSSRHHGKGLSRRALGRELRNKGVADETVGEALDEVTDDMELTTARALVERRLRSTRTDRPEMAFRRLVAMLARKGYAPATAVAVVRDALSDASAVGEEFDTIDVDGCEVLEGEA